MALHLGAVRLMLTLHGRKGLPVTARVTLLDSTYQQYEQAVVGTVLTTLNAGSAVLTIFPNFNVQLKDPTLPNRFKVQIQLVGAPQEETALSATLHHQIIYRIQDHCFDLPGEKEFAGNALMVLAAEDQEIPTIIQVPRQIPREELRQLIATE